MIYQAQASKLWQKTSLVLKKRPAPSASRYVGGAGGNRTRVRKSST